MESKTITAADVRNAISKRQIDFLTDYILRGKIDPESGILAEISEIPWINDNQMNAKILEETWEAIYQRFGLYLSQNSDGSIIIRIFPEDKNILKKYPIIETELWIKCKKEIKEYILKNNPALTQMFSEFVTDSYKILNKLEWINMQKESINTAISEMQKRRIAVNTASVRLKPFFPEAIKYAEDLGFEVKRVSYSSTVIKIIVPDTEIPEQTE